MSAHVYPDLTHKLAWWSFLTMLVVAPWLHGAEQLWEQMLVLGLIFVSLALLLVKSASSPLLPLPPALKWAFRAGCLWIGFNVVYLLPMPASLVSALSPNTFSWYSLPQPADEVYLSVYWFASAVELMKFVGLLALIPLVSWLCAAGHAQKIISTAVWIATLTSIYSLVNFATEGTFDFIPAIPPWDYSWQEGIRGTYSYKNQYATYLAMSVALGTGWSMSMYRAMRLRGERATHWLFSKPFLKLALVVLATGLIYITLLNTASRGALLSLTLSLFLVFGSYIMLRAERRKALLRPRIIIAAAIALIVGSAVFVQSAAFERFTLFEFEDNGRQQLRQTAMHVISDYPLTGTGPGTYPYIQHNYKPASLGNSGMSQRAHNDYLETLATQGIIGTSLAVLFISALLSGVFKRSKHGASPYLMACRCGILTLLIQSAFDVNISTYWLPVYFVILCALGWHFRKRASGLESASSLPT